ncbi:plasmid partitioning protein RepB [Rhizobium sp. ARZ01]|uniref:plasmid partitioning protein RepB n=1 Tax=Rhizobium sp. ARZ01 TaxID=2769313 RepID=UPI001784D28C|nr:plasmid partitioning protein RepB [Rhizobium sp. ARZ01]MBD9375512.1 plasmid partitioning protein RepB [Rhizobium sp. ARZ01]
MARKNLLAGLVDDGEASQADQPQSYPMRGASRSMVRSLDELSKQAEKFLEGEAVVELTPDVIDSSFVSDRMEDDSDQFEELKQAIAERGQDTPILVRPHPVAEGRYQIVFGHRRVRVARELGLKVRAVVKNLDDRTHIIAQGQENSARANLTFIERASFARRLENLGYDRGVVSSSLAANAAAVSKMMSITERIPASVIEAIGSAPAVGRERWLELSLLVGKNANAEKVGELLLEPSFASLNSDARFNHLFKALNKSGKPVKKAAINVKDTWQPADKAVSAQFTNTGKAFALSMKSKNAGRFGQFLAGNLDRLYAEFLSVDDGKGD